MGTRDILMVVAPGEQTEYSLVLYDVHTMTINATLRLNFLTGMCQQRNMVVLSVYFIISQIWSWCIDLLQVRSLG